MLQSCKDSDETKPLKLGPFGSESGGDSFDDGVHSTVRQLLISTNPEASRIVCIQIEYDDNGSSFWSDKHGEEDAYNTYTVCPVYVHPQHIYIYILVQYMITKTN